MCVDSFRCSPVAAVPPAPHGEAVLGGVAICNLKGLYLGVIFNVCA